MQLGPVSTNRPSPCWLLWQVAITKHRAMHNTFIEHGKLAHKLSAINRRVDDPVANPEVQGALGWVLKFDTKDPGYRYLGLNRKAMFSLAVLYRFSPLGIPPSPGIPSTSKGQTWPLREKKF